MLQKSGKNTVSLQYLEHRTTLRVKGSAPGWAVYDCAQRLGKFHGRVRSEHSQVYNVIFMAGLWNDIGNKFLLTGQILKSCMVQRLTLWFMEQTDHYGQPGKNPFNYFVTHWEHIAFAQKIKDGTAQLERKMKTQNLCLNLLFNQRWSPSAFGCNRNTANKFYDCGKLSMTQSHSQQNSRIIKSAQKLHRSFFCTETRDFHQSVVPRQTCTAHMQTGRKNETVQHYNAAENNQSHRLTATPVVKSFFSFN